MKISTWHGTLKSWSHNSLIVNWYSIPFSTCLYHTVAHSNNAILFPENGLHFSCSTDFIIWNGTVNKWFLAFQHKVKYKVCSLSLSVSVSALCAGKSVEILCDADRVLSKQFSVNFNYVWHCFRVRNDIPCFICYHCMSVTAIHWIQCWKIFSFKIKTRT